MDTAGARTHALLRRAVDGGSSPLRLRVLGAHPYDETLGAAGLLARHRDSWVVCLTDGAPRDRRFVPAGAPASTTGYARARREELRQALAIAGVGVDRLL